MEFKKVGKHTVRCILTEEDLIENDITIEDLVNSKEESRNFIKYLIDHAVMEVGFEPKEAGFMTVQITPFKDNGVVITIGDGSELTLNNIVEGIMNTVSSLIAGVNNQESKEASADSEADETSEDYEGESEEDEDEDEVSIEFDEGSDDILTEDEGVEAATHEKQEKEADRCLLIGMDNLSELEIMIRELSDVNIRDCELCYDKQNKIFVMACFIAGDNSDNAKRILHVAREHFKTDWVDRRIYEQRREHWKVIFKKNAIRKAKDII